MTKIKGKGPIVTASFDGHSKTIFSDLKTTKNLVLLSIKGNDYCAGDFLGAIIKNSVQSHQFTSFLIADEVYWHNLKNETTSEDEEQALRQQAKQLGLEFFEAQLEQFLLPLNLDSKQFNANNSDKTSLEKITIINELTKDKSEILLWSDWMERAPSEYQAISQFYCVEPKLVSAVEKYASDYARRHHTEADVGLLKHRSQGYLNEESPAVMWLAAYLGYNFIVYPGPMPEPFLATKDFFMNLAENQKQDDGAKSDLFLDNPNTLSNWLQVNFQRHPEPKAQPLTEVNPNQFFSPLSLQNKANPDANTDHLIQVTVATILNQENLSLESKFTGIAHFIAKFNELSSGATACCSQI